MRKNTVFLIFIVLLTVVFAPLCAGASTAGSAADPLVSKAWVDQYVAQQFAPLESRVAQLRQLITGQNSVSVTLRIDSPEVELNGVKRTIDAAPRIVGEGFTLVPIRFIAEALGLEVQWLAETRQVVFSNSSTVMQLTVGGTEAFINGEPYTMACPPIIDNSLSEGRTLVHVRFVGEAFGCELDWEPKDGATKEVYISR